MCEEGFGCGKDLLVQSTGMEGAKKLSRWGIRKLVGTRHSGSIDGREGSKISIHDDMILY